MPERVQVAVVGSGLAGLHAARLPAAGGGAPLLEARGRFGGRIQTTDEAGRPSGRPGSDPRPRRR